MRGVETDIVISGIGGQGVQLLSKVLARAALSEGLHAMLTAEYTGEMRGGRSFASLTLGDRPIQALPVPEKADAAMALHHLFWNHVDDILSPGALVVVEEEFADDLLAATKGVDPNRRIVRVAAAQAAAEAGSPMGAGLALLGAFSALTGAASIDRLVECMAQAIPSYRRQHIEPNARAIRAGAALVAPLAQPMGFRSALEAAS